MQLFNRKSQFQRLLDTVEGSLDSLSGVKLGMGGGSPARALKDAVPRDKAVRAGLIAGGLAGLTAGSAGISSLRRRQEGARDDS
jgi:hypothetical protein